MKLSFIFQQLAYGELKLLKLGGGNTEIGIATDDYPAMIMHVNLALTELHKRFAIRRETVHVQQYANISTYMLDYKHAVSNTQDNSVTKYLLDNVDDQYLDNLLVIDEVTDENFCPYDLNVIDNCYSLTTPIYNAINVPMPVDTNIMIVKYRANHPMISPSVTNIAAEEVALPMYLLQALLLFVAMRVHSSMPTLEGLQAAQQYERKYETELLRVDNLGLENKDQIKKDNIKDKKWE